MVAMSGWIMPAPLAQPPIVYSTPFASNVATASFWNVSVVMIARAKSAPPSECGSSCGIAERSKSMGK